MHAKHTGHTQTRQDNWGCVEDEFTVLDWSSDAGHYSGEHDNNIIQKKQTKLETTQGSQGLIKAIFLVKYVWSKKKKKKIQITK